MTRMELRFDAPVTEGGKRVGSLARVAIEDYGSRWQTLGISRDVLDLAEDIVPREAVLQASEAGIAVTGPLVVGAPPGARAISAHSKVLGVGDAVCGHVVALLSAEDGRIEQIVMQRRPFGERVLIPAEALAAIEPDAIIIGLTPQAIAALPVYRTDGELAYRAREALEGAGPLAEDDLRFLRVDVVDGIACLTGHIRFRTWADRVADEVGAIPGVLGVNNRIVCDDELAQEVAGVLAGVPHTHPYSFACTALRGVVELHGRAEDAATAEAAAEMTAELPTVRGVVDHIDAPGFVKDEDWMEPPAIGEPVYRDNSPLGSVERVVLDPRRRSFVGMIVDLRVPSHDSPNSELIRSTSLVSRMEAEVITAAAVFLSQSVPMKLEERPVQDLVVPAPADWRPPFPYAGRDVVWPAAAAAQPLPTA